MRILVKICPFVLLLDAALILGLLVLDTWTYLSPPEPFDPSWSEQEQASRERRITPPRRDVPRDPPELSCGRDDTRIPPAAGTMALVFGPREHAGWADYHSAPGEAGERLGQALIGDVIRILSLDGKWAKVELPGVPGKPVWLETSGLTAGSDRVRTVWQTAEIQMVTEAPGIEVDRHLFLPFGARLPVDSDREDHLRLLLPNGCEVTFGEIYRSSLSGPLALPDALEEAKYFRRIPYQKGANTRFAMDGSGLVFLVFRAVGRPLPRRLELLSQAGVEVSLESAMAGDVLFFETFNSERPQPVILLDGGQTYVAASPSGGVELGLLEQMRNRRLLTVRRYS